MEVKVFQIHKRSVYEYKFIQDKFSVNQENKTYAIADGTTQSFKSDVWAQLIVDDFCKQPNFIPTRIIESLKIQAKSFKDQKVEFSKNPAIAALENAKFKKGGTSTLIGIRVDKNNVLSAISTGDSNMFLLRGSSSGKYPFTTLDELDKNDNFVNTEKLLSDEVEELNFKTTQFKMQFDDIIILATDAISRLLLKDDNNINELLRWNSFQTFHDFCIDKWENKSLQEDDITVLIIKLNKSDSIKIFSPPPNFLFPKEEVYEFVPTTINENNNNLQNDINMNEILNRLNYINSEFVMIRKRLTFFQLLIIILLVINIAILMIVLTPKKTIFQKENIQTQEVSEKQEKQTYQSEPKINDKKSVDEENKDVQMNKSQTTNHSSAINEINTSQLNNHQPTTTSSTHKRSENTIDTLNK